MSTGGKRRVALVGAGNIAEAHAQALATLQDVEIAAVVEPRTAVAASMAERFGAGHVAKTFEEATNATHIDCAHILVPPPLHHSVAGPWIDKGIDVLLEKPLAENKAQGEDLLKRAAASGAKLGVNQNFVFHPSFQKLIEVLHSGRVGQLRHVDLMFAMPLRQLDAGQLGHWMFQQPLNILLEQAVHPLSQLRYLLGEMKLRTADAGDGEEIAENTVFHRKWAMFLSGNDATASLNFAVGESYPVYQITAQCSDGMITADMVRSTFHTLDRSRWPDAYDFMRSGLHAGKALRREARKGFFDYAFSQLGLKPRSDAFFQSMVGSIKAFHAALDDNTALPLDGAFGADLVTLCQDACKLTKVKENKTVQRAAKQQDNCDVAVLGGTGFIGRALIQQLINKGWKTRVMARHVHGLPKLFSHELVDIVRGDVTRRDDLEDVVDGAKYVVNLAHGGGGATRDAIYKALAGSAELVGQVCLDKKIERLVHISSIAALYLGSASDRITPDTPCDPKAESRNDYAWAKAEAEKLLLTMHKDQGLPVTIQRPGLVVGKGTPPFHSGLGFFNNEQHCIGWNEGENPLPFILVEDTASAIVAALDAENVDGRTDNIVGDVLMNARTFYANIQRFSGRPLLYHPQSPAWLQASEIFKWVIKRVGGRKAPFPSYRDLLSRGLKAQFECESTKSTLNWQPNKEESVFIEQAVERFFSKPVKREKDERKAAA